MHAHSGAWKLVRRKIKSKVGKVKLTWDWNLVRAAAETRRKKPSRLASRHVFANLIVLRYNPFALVLRGCVRDRAACLFSNPPNVYMPLWTNYVGYISIFKMKWYNQLHVIIYFSVCSHQCSGSKNEIQSELRRHQRNKRKRGKMHNPTESRFLVSVFVLPTTTTATTTTPIIIIKTKRSRRWANTIWFILAPVCVPRAWRVSYRPSKQWKCFMAYGALVAARR